MSLTVQPRPKSIAYGEPPRVNLLPPAERERRALARLRRRWIIAVIGVLALMVVVIAAAFAMRVQAKMGLDDAEAQKADLDRQLTAYADVSTKVSERDSLVAKRAEAFAADMSWSKPYRLLSAALPAGARLTGFTGAAGGVATGRNGELGLKGTATVVSDKPIDQAIVLDRFGKVRHVNDVDMLGLQQAEDVYTYSVYVAFDQGMYNPRFHTDSGETK